MKFEDENQNLRLRMGIIHALVFVILAVLGVRLYYLQVVNGGYYSERAENQRVRLLRIPAPRGAIFDRNGKLLVDSRATYNIILLREDMKGKDWNALVNPLSDGLDLDPEFLRDRFETMRAQPAFEDIVIKENASPGDLAWVEARTLEYPMLSVREQPQRRYPDEGVLAHVLGYVGEISPAQLKQDKFKDYTENPYRPGDVIGQEGLESTYDRYLRGRDGYRKVEVDSRGRIQRELEVVPPQPGQDLVTTIDLDMQLAAEKYLRESPSGRGVIVMMNPNNGEILTMASYPTYDPNLFSQRILTKEGRAEARALLRDPLTPLYNRAIQGRYPPGSTWKLLMASAGLEQGAITPKNSTLSCGGGIQIGSKFTRCMGNHGSPDVRVSIQRSCNGYYYRLGLRMGLDGIQRMVDDFELNRRTGIDLPQERVSWTPSREFKARFNPRDPDWRDIDTVYSSIGQVYDIVTPMALLRAVASISVGGRLYVPHVLKEARAVAATDHFPAREARGFDRPDPKIIPMRPEHTRLVLEGAYNAVNAGGSAGRARIENFDVAGKTGTAQVAERGKAGAGSKDHAWFVSFAPAYQPELAAVAIVENVGFGGTHAAPAVRAVYEAYLAKRHPELLPDGGDVVASNR
jgi:penicillin-binding protein 2